MTRDEFIVQQDLAKRDDRKASWVLAIGGLVSLFGLMELVHVVPKEYRNVSALVMFVVIIGIATSMDKRAKTKLRSRGLACANCGLLLTGPAGQVAVATGKCGGCGTPIFTNNNA